MAGRPRSKDYKPRSDTGTKRASYNTRYEKRGKVDKESNPIKSFWTHHTMDQVMAMSNKELDKAISKWIQEYENKQIARNKFWWYPSIAIKTLNEVRNTRTDVDKGWHL